MIHLHRTFRHSRTGVSLLETLVSTAILGLIVTAAAVSVRTSQGVWDDYGGDAAKLDAAHATALHLVRHIRQCVSVTSITAAAENNGSLTTVNGDGETLTWQLGGGNVSFGIAPSSDVLCDGITALNFTGYEVDGSTTTTTAADIRSVEFVVTVTLDRAVNPTRTIRSRVWLRAW